MWIAIWIALGVGIVVLLALVAWLFFRSQPRMQHYMFAHDVVPQAIFNDPIGCLPLLLSNGRSSAKQSELLTTWWQQAKQSAPFAAEIPVEEISFRTEVLGHPNATAFIIEMPPPEKKREAAAIIVVADGPGLAVGKMRHLRYFALEFDGSGRASIGEWFQKSPGKLSYREHGGGHSVDVDAFVKAVHRIVEVDGSMPAPTK
jgi:hypothetical protein